MYPNTACNRLYERRLQPVFGYIQARAADRQRQALVTVPGLGCGQFAGPFLGRMGPVMQQALEHVLTGMNGSISRIRAVVFDPYNECQDVATTIGATRFRVRPLLRSRHPNPQLCWPEQYVEGGDDFSDCDLYSLVAWDQVSWPGNDFYASARATDDGVKAAATSSMLAMTGIPGRFDANRGQYLPPDGYSNWRDCVEKNGLTLRIADPFVLD
jgi:hypothetical protein